MTFRVKDLMITVLPEHIRQAMELCGATAANFSCGMTDPPSCGITSHHNCGMTDPPSCGATDPPNCGMTDPPSCGMTDPPSCGMTDPPSCGATDPPNCGMTDPPSCGMTDPPSCGTTDPPSCGMTDPPSCGATDPPSCGATDPPSCGATDPPSCGVTDCGATHDSGGLVDRGDPFTNPAVLRFQLEQILAGMNAHELRLQGATQARSISTASLHEVKAMEARLTEALAEIQAQRRKIEQQGH